MVTVTSQTITKQMKSADGHMDYRNHAYLSQWLSVIMCECKEYS